MSDQGNILSIDFGDRHFGFAYGIANPKAISAIGDFSLKQRKDQEESDNYTQPVLNYIHNIYNIYRFKQIVIGLPLKWDGSIGHQAKKVILFAKLLKKEDVPIHFVDERLSSWSSQSGNPSGKKHSKMPNARSAEEILNTFLSDPSSHITHPWTLLEIEDTENISL